MNAAREQTWQLCYPEGLCLRGAFLNCGDGSTGVFIHGFRSDAGGNKSLALMRHAAARNRSWLRFDLRGHGRSDGDLADFRISSMLADVEAAITRVSGGLYIVGSSMGAWLAVLAALRHPTRIKGLLLLAPGFNFIQHHFERLLPTEQLAWQKTGARGFKSHYDDSTYALEYAAVADARRFDVLQGPITLACPVTLIHGEHDEIVPVTIPTAFFEALRAPAKHFVTVPRGDHRLSGAEPLICAELDRLWQG